MDICYECQEPMVKKQGEITFTKPGYGQYKVKGVIHLACDTCGAKIILPNETKRIEEEGIRLHMLKVLTEKNKMTALELKEFVGGQVDILEKVALKLKKEGLIKITYTNKDVPIVSIAKTPKKCSMLSKFLNILFLK